MSFASNGDLLRRFGWNDALDAAFAAHAPAGAVPGRVLLEHNHVYRIVTADGEWLAEAAGRLKHEAAGRHELPAVGDWVAVRPPASQSAGAGRATIRTILPRRSQFSRKVAGRETEEQIVAANIDVVFLVATLDEGPNTRSLERYLVLARRSGAEPVVVLNKLDLAADVGGDVAEVVAAAPDVPVLAVSAKDGRGFDRLDSYLQPGRTVALLGPSGVGKSSIVNRLVGHALLATAEVRDWDGRGRHTSVHRQLVMLASGAMLIDTPGMRELQLWDSGGGVDETFADIDAIGASCKFRDCRHDREPGCAVKAAVDAGTLDASRYESFLKLQGEREDLTRRQDERAILDQKRLSKIANKALKAMQKDRGR